MASLLDTGDRGGSVSWLEVLCLHVVPPLSHSPVNPINMKRAKSPRVAAA